MTLREMREARATKAAAMRKLVDDHPADKWSTDLQKQFDAFEADIQALDAEIDRHIRTMDVEAKGKGEGRTATATFRDGAIIISDEADPARTFGFKTMAEFGTIVRAASVPGGSVDERLRAAAAGQQGQGGDEGYLIPPEFSDRVWQVAVNVGDILPYVDTTPTSARAVQSLVDETTPWNNGVEVKWRVEGTKMTASKGGMPIPRETKVEPLSAFIRATDELLEDAPQLNAMLTDKAGQAIGWKLNEAVISGDGVGKPLGYLASKGRVTVAKDDGQAAGTVSLDNVLAMWERLLVMPGDSPFWLTRREVVTKLMKLTIGTEPIWIPPNGSLQDAPGGFLLGYPIRLSEHAEVIGTEGDLTLMSPKGYRFFERANGVTFAASSHLYFDSSETAFRWTFRAGGDPLLSKPWSPAKGAADKAHFVTLATRA